MFLCTSPACLKFDKDGQNQRFPTGGYLDGKQQRFIMAEAHDVVDRSFNINSKLGPRLIAAAEQNAILRIGWTNAGEPVPKNGELGLCPNLPKGARMRALHCLVQVAGCDENVCGGKIGYVRKWAERESD